MPLPTKTVAFLFSGLGGQWPGMGAGLMRFPAARAAMEACNAALVRQGVAPVLEALASPSDRSFLRRTDRAQAALFTLQVGQVAQWAQLGVEPDVVAGFSLGEVAAAWAAGIHDLDDAARVIAACGQGARAVHAGGRMMAVALDAAEAARLAAGRVEVAAFNGPGSCALAGDAEAIEQVRGDLHAAGIWCRVLGVEHPFHTDGMAEAGTVMRGALADLVPSPPRIPIYSTVTGGRFAGMYDAAYWGDSVQAPVAFEGAVRAMGRDGVDMFVQIGAHPDLERPLVACTAEREATLVATLRRDEPAAEALSDAALQFWSARVASRRSA